MYLNQSHFKDFLTEREITWVGLDFSKAKFTRKSFSLPQDVLTHYMTSWNLMIISDQKKYDIRLSFRKPVMQYDLSMVTKKNKAVKAADLLCDTVSIDNILSDNDIVSYVSTLTFPKQTLYAIFTIVESFDETTKMASLWIVIARTDTSETVLCENFMKSPGGFGLQSYWGRTFYNLFFDINKYAFTRWENSVKTDSIELK